MRKFGFIASLTLAVGQSPAAESAASPILQQAYDRLVSVRFFAFGPAGPAGMTSPGERSLRTLATNADGLPLFKAALTNGTTEARLYALCGIRHLAPEEFDALAAPIAAANARVSLMVGDIQMQLQASNLVAQIKRGSYDDFFPPGTSSR